MSEKVWVFSWNAQRYLDWCQLHGLDPHDRAAVRMVTSPISLRHLRDAQFVLLPNWSGNPCYRPLELTRGIIAKCGRVVDYGG